MLMKLNNFEKAVARLREGVGQYDGLDKLARDGLIQRFEFTFELAWETLKAVFEHEGLVGTESPRLILREAYGAGLIEEEKIWLQILKEWNSTAHLYNEKIAL